MLEQMGLIDTYRIFLPTAGKCTFSSSTPRIFSRTDHMVGHQISLSEFKKTEFIPSIFPDYSGKKLEINSKGKLENWQICGKKTTNSWTTSGTKKELKGKSKKFLETNKIENTTYQNLWNVAKAVLSEKFTVIKAYIKKNRSQIHCFISSWAFWKVTPGTFLFLKCFLR